MPPNNSLSFIKDHYRQSCAKMLAMLPELNVDFTVDQTENPDFRSESRTRIQFARRILKASSNVDHRVALEYRRFLEHCALRRTAAAMALAQAMLAGSELERSYRERYAQASREFLSTADAQLASSSDSVTHITSSKHMQAVRHAAELDISRQGSVVKALQADEAKLILDIRQEQYVLSEVLGIWQSRHSKVLHKFSTSFKRLSGLLDSHRTPLASVASSISSYQK